MAVVEVSIVPVGPAGASISRYVARCLDILDQSGLDYELCPMGTVIEGELALILDAVREMHDGTFGNEVVRVLTTIRIDDRRDKELTMDGKIDAVRRHRKR
jgi:uncharacterized protein (TIGR00106 family)